MHDICLGNTETFCGTQITDNDDAIECEMCKVWHHISCQNLSITAYKAIEKHELFWVCDGCKLKCLKLNEPPDQDVLLKRFELLENKLDSKISDLETIFKKSCEEQKENICKSYSDVTKNIAEVTTKSVIPDVTGNQKATKLLVKEIINEYESENRELNVIVYNCDETQDGVNDFIKIVRNGCEVAIGKNDIEKVNRIGLKNNDKTRPLLVCLKNIDKKKEIMNGSRKLKEKAPGIYINHDRSKEEREHFNETRAKQKKMISDDTSGEWFFRIKGPPWNLKITREKKKKVTTTVGLQQNEQN